MGDVEGLFNSQQYDSLERAIIDFIISKKIDLLIVSIEDLYPYDDFEDFAVNQRIRWNVGGRYENGGILLVISKSGNNSFITINKHSKEVLNEDECLNALALNGQPEFEKGRYFKGILKSIEALTKMLDSN